MMQALRTENCRRPSLRNPQAARRMLIRMAEDADRAARLRGIYDERPELTWVMIADACGVKERTVHGWRKDGTFGYANAKKLARYLNVDLDWLWRGPKTAPDLMGALSRTDQIERDLAEALRLLRAIEQQLKTGPQ